MFKLICAIVLASLAAQSALAGMTITAINGMPVTSGSTITGSISTVEGAIDEPPSNIVEIDVGLFDNTNTLFGMIGGSPISASVPNDPWAGSLTTTVTVTVANGRYKISSSTPVELSNGTNTLKGRYMSLTSGDWINATDFLGRNIKRNWSISARETTLGDSSSPYGGPLSGTVQVAEEDIMTTGSIWVMAVLGGKRYFLTQQGWTGTQTSFPPFKTGTLGQDAAPETFSIWATPPALCDLPPAIIYIGYGRDLHDMLDGEKYANVHTHNFPTCLSLQGGG